MGNETDRQLAENALMLAHEYRDGRLKASEIVARLRALLAPEPELTLTDEERADVAEVIAYALANDHTIGVDARRPPNRQRVHSHMPSACSSAVNTALSQLVPRYVLSWRAGVLLLLHGHSRGGEPVAVRAGWRTQCPLTSLTTSR